MVILLFHVKERKNMHSLRHLSRHSVVQYAEHSTTAGAFLFALSGALGNV